MLEGIYTEEQPLGVPKTVLVPIRARRSGAVRGMAVGPRAGLGRTTVRVPQRGGKRELQETVTRNAKEEFTRHRLRRSSDHNAGPGRSTSCRTTSACPIAPLRIECFDMSHMQGTDYVGSMVVVEDGLPKKSDYRRFQVRDVPGNDDFAAMEEVLTRRLTAYLVERKVPAAERARPSRSSPTRPSCCWSTAARASSTSP